MRQRITHHPESVLVEDVNLLPTGEPWKITLMNPDPGEVTFLLSQPGKAVHLRMVFENGVPRFERQIGAAPAEFLQRDLVDGTVRWAPEKPYRSSGREYVKVELGLEVVG